MDDFVLNLRQIAQYPSAQAGPLDQLLFQQGGVGGPYASSSIQDLVAAGAGQLAPSAMLGGSNLTQLTAGVLSLSGKAPSETSGDPAIGFNLRWDTDFNGRRVATGPGALIWQDQANGTLYFEFAPSGPADALVVDLISTAASIAPDGTLNANRVLIAAQGQGDADAVTVGWINRQAVRSFNGRFGAIVLNRNDILRAGGAASFNTELSGQPLAPTASSECRHQVANVEFVECRIADWINGLINEHPFVWTFNKRRGDICLNADDLTSAGFLDPANPPEVPTAPDGTATDQAASTLFVSNELENLLNTDIADYLAENYAPLDSPQLTGAPSAPTPPAGTSDSQLATTAFVTNAVVGATTGVASFNTRTGNVVFEQQDYLAVGGASTLSPTFTGSPSAPTPPSGNISTRLATTAFVADAVAAVATGVSSFNTRTGPVTLTWADVSATGAAPLISPSFSGVAIAPTLPPGTNTQQIATTAFVLAEIAAMVAGVNSFNGRTGTVTLQQNDITAVGGALLLSPGFSGTPRAPTALLGDSSTQIATTAFVTAALTLAGVSSFNTRTGAVSLTAADVTAVGGALLASPALSGTPTAPTPGFGTNSTQLATCAFVASSIALLPAPVQSFNGRTGSVSLLAADISAAGGAPLASPAFSGTPTAPTAANGDASTQLATTAFVENAITGSTAGVATWNGRAGHVSLALNDITAVGGADASQVLPLSGGSVSGNLTVGGTLATSTVSTNGLLSTWAGQSWQVGPNVNNNDGGQFQPQALFMFGTRSGVGSVALATYTNTAGWVGYQSRIDNNSANLVNFAWGSSSIVGSITTNGSSVSYNSSSDARLKDNVRPLGDDFDVGGLIDQMAPVAFEWNNAPDYASGVGFIAQDLQAVVPESVQPGDADAERHEGDEGFRPWGVDHSKLVPYLVAELQSLRARVAALEV